MKKLSIYVLLIASSVAVFSGCKKSSSNSPNSSSASYYFAGTIDGKSIKYEVTSSGEYSLTTSANGNITTPPNTTQYAVGGVISNVMNVPEDYPYIGLNYQTMSWVDWGDADSVFLNTFTTGSQSFVYTTQLGANGVYVDYAPTDSVTYSTIGGVGILQPSSSYVKVTAVDKHPSELGADPYVVVTADIKAVLYERNDIGDLTGKTVPIEGTIKVLIEKIF